ncbi:hypothetical protein VL20_696 [Microcystis panniformis FACHB-1757]|uniref:Uncharacterized protein n=1 Tax=Microcystis panniformis FACHB-1757 TaxID=1638788 RepID=A0A0K1RVS2_9CHRO|nr:hypothetical protein VL20_696 [Microcystis panniformis FACHB-1757]
MKESTVPTINLAPKLRRDLSLWNPFDYLLLLYWVFYFPQAVRWYVETRGGGDNHPVQLRLGIQGLLLTVITPLIICSIAANLGLSVNWVGVVWGAALGVALGAALGVALGVVSGVVWGVVSGAVSGVVWGVVSGVASGVVSGVVWGVVFGAWWGVVSGVVLIVVWGVAWGVVWGVVLGVVWGVVWGVSGVSGVEWGVVWGVSGAVLGVVLIVVWGVAWGVVWGVSGVVFIFAFFRLDNWLIGLLAGSQGRLFPRITPLPLPGLTSTLQQWLQQDWETAINNLNQYLRYSRQFIPVLAAVNRVLPQFPEAEIIYRVSRLAENPSDWQLLKYASAKPFSFPDSQIRLDTPARAAAAGFWYLHQQDTEKAEKAFAVVRSLAYGEEMYSLAQTLHRFSQAATFDSIASLEVAPIAAEPSLRPQTWQAISSLNRVIAEVALVQRSDSQETRKLALKRIIRELRDIIDRQAANLPQAEKELILSIAQKWKTCCSSSL